MSSDHQRARELFSAHRDGDLSPADGEWIESHLRACPECRREYDDLCLALSPLAALKATPPAGFVGGIESEIRRRSRGRFFAGGGRTRLGPLALETISLLTLVALVLLYWFTSMP